MITPYRKRLNETGSDSAGQSGDVQQIHDAAEADSESVAELVEEGNAYEAGAVYGVESAQDPDVAEVNPREFSEDDIPDEYLNTYVEFQAWDSGSVGNPARH